MTQGAGQAQAEDRRLFAAAGLLLASALIAGGTSRALNDLVILLASLPLLYLLLARPGPARLPWTAKLALALLGLAALQLVPLPPAIWTMLPGREIAASALIASGQEPGWRPVALNPFAAGVALLTCIAPIAMHIAASRLDPAQLRRLLAGTALFALGSAVLGITQRVANGLAVYSTDHAGAALGLFANRNHHADLLIAGMLLIPALLPRRVHKAHKALASCALVLLVFAVIATTSRAGIALALPAACAALVVVWRPPWRLAGALVIGAIGACLAMLLIPAFSDIFARFAESANDQRITMARDTMVATRAMWPFGAGYGSFVPVYMAFENLDTMEARYVVAAHNDYLQLMLEGGLAGAITAIAGVFACALIGWSLFRQRAAALGWMAWGVAVLLLAHSALDYPMRTGALAVLFGLCTGIAQNRMRALRGPLNSG